MFVFGLPVTMFRASSLIKYSHQSGSGVGGREVPCEGRPSCSYDWLTLSSFPGMSSFIRENIGLQHYSGFPLSGFKRSDARRSWRNNEVRLLVCTSLYLLVVAT